jgi:hypothetical protein
LRSQLRLASGEGLVVTDVVADGPAAKAGVKKHDVLTMLDGKRLTTVEAINSQVQSIKDRKVSVVFVRGGQEMSRELAPMLSTTPAIDFVWPIANSNTFLGVQNRNPTWHFDVGFQPNPTWQFELAGRPYVHWSQGSSASDPNAKPATPADQIAAMKKQLGELQKSLAALESVIQQPPAQKQVPQTPQKK